MEGGEAQFGGARSGASRGSPGLPGSGARAASARCSGHLERLASNRTGSRVAIARALAAWLACELPLHLRDEEESLYPRIGAAACPVVRILSEENRDDARRCGATCARILRMIATGHRPSERFTAAALDFVAGYRRHLAIEERRDHAHRPARPEQHRARGDHARDGGTACIARCACTARTAISWRASAHRPAGARMARSVPHPRAWRRPAPPGGRLRPLPRPAFRTGQRPVRHAAGWPAARGDDHRLLRQPHRSGDHLRRQARRAVRDPQCRRAGADTTSPTIARAAPRPRSSSA